MGGSTDTILSVDLIDPLDLTDTLQQGKKRIVGHGYLGTVYHCFDTRSEEVAVKAISFPRGLDGTEKDMFIRKVRRELGIWRRLDHPNIVPFLGTACGDDFGSDHPCMVSMWMPHGTLIEYLKHRGTMLSLPHRIELIKGSVAGLEYLHSMQLVHGDFHPGNILIDDEHNPRLTDFGLSQTLIPVQDQLAYLWTNSIRPGAVMWAAPELQYPGLYPDVKIEATLNSDIYSLGSIILVILSGKYPWPSRREAEDKLQEFQNPPRPAWPTNIPDGVWNLIERCWSPRQPRDRPSAQEVMSFSGDRLEQLLLPNPASIVNIILFGDVGCGKSSIINLLAGESIAQVSADVQPCTKRPRWYQIFSGERRIRLWDTMGFRFAHGEEVDPLSPYKQAHAVLQNLPDGVNLILLCARKDGIFASLGSLYWLINDFFFGGRAPIAFVVTHLDTLDERWWERNRDSITERTGIPVESLPHACVTTGQTGRDQSKYVLRALIQTYAAAIPPIIPRLERSFHTTASLDLITHCKLSPPEATALVEEFNRPRNVVLFGQAGAGRSSVINLIAGHPVAHVNSGLESCTLNSTSYKIDTPMKKFVIWDTQGFQGIRNGQDVTRRAVVQAAQLIRDLFEKSGVDLLVFVKEYGKLNPSEMNCYRLFEEFLCKGQVPVAVVITHLESCTPMERWWEMNGGRLLKALGGNVIGHACITSLATNDQEDSEFSKNVSESRLALRAMLEQCVSFPNRVISDQLPANCGGETDRVPERMTVDNLMEHCGLTRELANQVTKLWMTG